jgi:cell division protein FtsB
MPLFLLSLIPAKATLDSLKYGAIAVLCGLLLVVGVSVLHTPSKVSYAVSAEHAKGNVEKLQFALKAEQAEKAAALEALEAGKRQKKAQADQNAELSARVSILESENAKLKTPRPDDATPVLDPNDSWLLRGPKAGSPDRARAPRS